MMQFNKILLSIIILLMPCLQAQAGEGESASAETKPGVVGKVEHAVAHGAKSTVNGIKHGGKAVASGLKHGGEAVAHGIDVGVKATVRTTHRVVDKIEGKAKPSEQEK
jgi:hypothetical protein